VENTTIPNNNQGNTDSGLSQAPVKKSVFPKIILLLVLVIVVATVLFLTLGKKITNNKNSVTKTNQEQSSLRKLPKNNLLVYTRCFGGERQPNSCKLYTSSLKDQQEQEIYSFDFPKVQQTDYETGFDLYIHGIVNKKAVYSKSYWEKKDKTSQSIKILGMIDLQSGEDSEIYKTVNSSDTGYLVSVYLDKQNNKVYYTTEVSPDINSKITQFDIAIKGSAVVADNNKLGGTYDVLAATKDKLFLSPVVRVGSSYSWTAEYSLASKTKTNLPKSKSLAIFDKSVRKVAYLDKKELHQGYYNIRLKVANTDGTEEKEIYVANNTRIPGDGYDGSYPYTYIADFFFNDYGDRLSFGAGKSKLQGNRYDGVDTNNYISFLEVRSKEDPEFPRKGGIVLLSPDNPNLYKTLISVKPTEQKYQWVKYLTYEGPIQGSPQDGLLYEADGGWYLKESLNYDEQEKVINLLADRKVVLTKAKNVFLVP